MLHSRLKEDGAGLSAQKPQEQIQPNVKQAQSWVMSCRGQGRLPSCTETPFPLKGLLLLLLSCFSRVRLCDPMDGPPPGSTIPGILQARTLERVAISFSNT